MTENQDFIKNEGTLDIIPEPKFDKEIKLNNNIVKARKWKAKDKFEFKKIIKNENGSFSDILVYNCLDKKIALSEEEYKYVLTQIRCHSLGETIKLEFYCEHCESRFSTELNLNDLIKPIISNKDIIQTEKHIIQLGEVINPEFYKKVILQAPAELDFYLRIKTINDNECFSIESVVNYFNEMDIDEFESIMEQWEEIKFKVDDIVEVKCTNCEEPKKYKFDEIPGFFPESWFE